MTATFLSLSHPINQVRSLSGGIDESSQASAFAADCFDRVLYSFTLGRRLDHGSKFSRRFPLPLDFVPYGIRKPSGGILGEWGQALK